MNAKRLLLLLSAAIPFWIVNPANPPDITVNWKTNQAWTKHGGVTTPAALGITTSRASVKQVVDSNGNWSQVAANVTARSDLGRSTEEARTNSIRNNTMQGAVVCADNVELTTNGNFASAGAGWTTQTAGGGAITFATGSVTMSGDGVNAINNAITQQISGLKIGRNYVLTVAGSTTGVFPVSVGNSAFDTTLKSQIALVPNGGNNSIVDRIGFTATATSHWITVGRQNVVAATITSVSLQDGERCQNGGFTVNPLSASQSTLFNGWEWTLNTGTGTVTWNGSSNVTLTGDGTHGAAISIPIPTLINATYTITVDITGNAASVQVGTAAFGSGSVNVTSGTTTGQQIQFTASATTMFVTFFHLQATASVIANVSVQSAGSMPTNWTGWPSGQNGLLRNVVAVGVVNGIDCVDVAFFGTSAATNFNAAFETNTAITSAYGQTWTASLFIAVVAGTLPVGWSINLSNGEYNANTLITNHSSAQFQASLTSSLQRISTNATNTNSATTAQNTFINVGFTTGTTHNYTLRVGWPQLENNSINALLASATIAAGGASGVTGTAVYSVGGGTGTAATLNVTVSGGAITAINSVASAGSYTVFPTSPAALTYVSGTGSGVVGATVNLTPTNLAANAFATSPIKTTSVALTRNADVTVLTGQTFGSAYSLFTQETPQAPITNITPQVAIEINDGTAANRAQLVRNGGTGFSAISVKSGNVAQFGGNNGVAWAQNTQNKAAISEIAGAQALVVNGGAAVNGAGATLPVGANAVYFGSAGGGNFYFNGLAAIDAIWLTQAVPSAQLQSMTA